MSEKTTITLPLRIATQCGKTVDDGVAIIDSDPSFVTILAEGLLFSEAEKVVQTINSGIKQ